MAQLRPVRVRFELPLLAALVATLILGCRGTSPLADGKNPPFLAAGTTGSDDDPNGTPPGELAPLAERIKKLKFVEPLQLKEPSNDRDWIPEQVKLASVEYRGDDVTVHNIRNAEYYTYSDCVVDWYDKTFNLKDLETVDFILIPFSESPSIAHTMLSFGLKNGDQIGVSVEVRLEKGEQYDTALGLFGQFELMYLLADERDLIRSRVEHRNVDVYLYPSKATPEQVQRLFVDMMTRVNKLDKEPEFYDTLTNNCTTNLVRHINHLAPGRVPSDFRVLLPGFSDQLAYELGLLDNRLPFEELKRRSRVNDASNKYRDSPQYSVMIRRELAR
jgi:hypothetical protein